MGNILWCCCKGEDEDVGDHYPYYSISRPHYEPPHYQDHQIAAPAPASATSRSSLLRLQPPSGSLRPQRQQQPPPVTNGVSSTSRTSLVQYLLPPETSRPQQQQPPPVTNGVFLTSRSSLVQYLPPPETSRPQQQQPPPVTNGVSSTSRSSLVQYLPPPETSRPQQQQKLFYEPATSRSSLVRSQASSVPAYRPRQQQSAPVPHGVASSTSRNSLLRFQLPPVPACRVQQQEQQPPPVSRSLLRFEHHLFDFVFNGRVPEGLGEHVASSKEAQVKWYRNILEAYRNTEPSPETTVEAAMLIATALSSIDRASLEGILAFYGFAIPAPPVVTTELHPSSLPEGVQYVLKTLAVNAKCIGDGDGFTAYVDTADPMELKNVPQEVRDAVTAMAQARKCRNNQMKNGLRNKLREAGYRIIYTSKDEILARQYRFRLRGIDAPEMEMQYGKESQDALVKLIAGKSVMVYVYGQDRYKRYVGDIYCDGVFIQEQMLKNGHAWHHKIYDKRPEFSKWELKAQDARRGLWASDNPEKPWEWKRNKGNARHENTPDNLRSRGNGKGTRAMRDMRIPLFKCNDGPAPPPLQWRAVV